MQLASALLARLSTRSSHVATGSTARKAELWSASTAELSNYSFERWSGDNEGGVLFALSRRDNIGLFGHCGVKRLPMHQTKYGGTADILRRNHLAVTEDKLFHFFRGWSS